MGFILNRNSVPSICFVLYLFMFSFLKIVWVEVENVNTTLFLGLGASTLLLCSFSFSKRIILSDLIKALFFLFINVAVFVFFAAINFDNKIFYERLYEFIIFGVVPVLLFSQLVSLEVLFKAFTVFSILLFVLYAADPFYNYRYTNNYMEYGFQIMMPVFFGLHLGRVLFRWKYLIILQVLTFALILIFGNRMASLSCLFFLIFIDLFYLHFNQKKKFFYLFIFVLTIIFFSSSEDIVIFFSNTLEEYGLSSYSFSTILNFSDFKSFSAGRNLLWDSAIEMILKKPFFGYGIGAFETTYGTYPHNFILELLLSFGFFGFSLFFLLLVFSFRILLLSKGLYKLLGILLFCTSFPKLLTSIYLFQEPTFWLFIFYGVSSSFLIRFKK